MNDGMIEPGLSGKQLAFWTRPALKCLHYTIPEMRQCLRNT